jgi:hypothetical protein
MKLYAIEFGNNLSVSIDGSKRTNYRKGDKVVCGRDDRMNLIRLGCSQIDEIEASYADVFKKKGSVEVPVPEVVIATPVIETNEVVEEPKLHWKQKLKLEREAAEAEKSKETEVPVPKEEAPSSTNE